MTPSDVNKVRAAGSAALSYSVKQARQRGRLGLTIYVVPGFPNMDFYSRVRDYLEDCDFVSIVETAVPVKSGFSEYANDVIKQAHKIAFDNVRDPFALKLSKPVMLVLYRHSAPTAPEFKAFLSRLQTPIEGMILEWDCNERAEYLKVCREHGIELVFEVDPSMDMEEMNEVFQHVGVGGHVYLVSADATGAPLYDMKQLAACLSMAKKMRSDVTISAGFGIAQASQIRQLGKLSDLDGVIIGTEFLKRMKTSNFDVIKEYLEEVKFSLNRTTNY